MKQYIYIYSIYLDQPQVPKKGRSWESTYFNPRTEVPPEAKKTIRNEIGEIMPHLSLGFEAGSLRQARLFFAQSSVIPHRSAPPTCWA